MTDERVKQLMEQVGMPNSQSVYQMILQVENETEQRVIKQTACDCLDSVFGSIDETRARIRKQYGIPDLGE